MANKKRLIDADALRQTIESKIYWGGVGLLEAIDEAPAVDAVEVVRCSDCKHWDEIEDTCGGGYCNHRCWFVLDAEPPIVNHSDFCSYGEKREV